MLRVFRDDDGEWWVQDLSVSESEVRVQRMQSVDDLAGEAADRLAVLLHVEPGKRIEGIGRRISEDMFWVFTKE